MQCIQSQYYGELTVGQATVIEMNSHNFSRLVVASTMRIPGNVSQSINAYLAMRAVLMTLQSYNTACEKPIKTVAIPTFCTGVGGMSTSESAEQMALACDMIVNGRYRQVIHPAMAPLALK